MRHKIKGRTLSRTASHRRAMFRNMAASMIKTLLPHDEESGNKAPVPGRIITTVAKAKELRPYIERLITLAKKSLPHQAKANGLITSEKRGSKEWKDWRKTAAGQQWLAAVAPAIDARRKAASELQDKDAVRLLFDILAPRFANRNGGYTRIVRLAKVRLGDAGERALIEFVGERDRVSKRRGAAPAVVAEGAAS